MLNRVSRFIPRNPVWYEELPGRTAPLETHIDVTGLEEDLISVDQDHLDISRTSSVLRGAGVFMGSLGLLILCWFAPHILASIMTPPRSVVVISILTIQSICLAGYSLFLIWLDCRIPRDLPVRFDRRTRKVHVQDFNLSLNPFVRRKPVFKTFDWTGIEAELTKQAGFNGKAYMVRYALVLVICRPGSQDVLERINLKANDITIKGLQAMWSYVRRYMEEGTAGLPSVRARTRGLSLWGSLFNYMPYIDPGKEGCAYRGRMGAVDVILAFLMIWLFWIWLPLGLCHYIAMRSAPEPLWPSFVE